MKMTLDRFEKFMDGLSEHDRMNFGALLSLPTALKVISELPGGEYKDAAIFGLALKQVFQDQEDESSS